MLSVTDTVPAAGELPRALVAAAVPLRKVNSFGLMTSNQFAQSCEASQILSHGCHH